MASSSKVRRIGSGPRSGAAGIGMLPIPDPRFWPNEIREWFEGVVGQCGPLDVYVFNHGKIAALYLQDAVTAAALLEVHPSEWHTERGYPAYFFDPARIGEIQHRLGIVGYDVHVLEPFEGRSQTGKSSRARVLSITVARGKKGVK